MEELRRRLPSKRRWQAFFASYAVILVGVGLAYLFNDQEADREVLLLLNPDVGIWLLDQAFVLVTDFSVLAFVVWAVAWEVGYQSLQVHPEWKPKLVLRYKQAGGVVGLVTAGTFAFGLYHLTATLVFLGVVLFAGFWWVAEALENRPPDDLARMNQIFWLACLSVLLAYLGTDGVIKPIVRRPRPLSPENAAWNGQLRLVLDEVVRDGFSYPSGHSAALFALTTPVVLKAKRVGHKVAGFAWAALHAFSRVYLAAHFPFCALMGSLLGFCVALAATVILTRP
ncbi:MAG: hypothetical protein Kow0069_34240 [Promethearchaeota archaeon]